MWVNCWDVGGQTLYDRLLDGVITWFWAKVKLNRSEEFVWVVLTTSRLVQGLKLRLRLGFKLGLG